jgi:hypothetical protein
LDEIPNVIAQHQQQQQQQYSQEPASFPISESQANATPWNDTHPMTDNNEAYYNGRKRRKIEDNMNDIQKKIQSFLWLRLLGTIVNVTVTSEESQQHIVADENRNEMLLFQHDRSSSSNNRNEHTYDHTITIDDGTSTSVVVIYITLNMIRKISIQAGMIVDCIVRVEQPRPTLYGMKTPSTTAITDMRNIRFIADQLAIQDTTTETLRWLELSHLATAKKNSSNNHSSENRNENSGGHNDAKDDFDCMCDVTVSSNSISVPNPNQYTSQLSSNWRGYPTRDLSSEDIYRVIASECEVFSDEVSSSTTNGRGVSLQNLADCFDYSVSYISTLVQELQNSGQIYQNENGLFTLL